MSGRFPAVSPSAPPELTDTPVTRGFGALVSMYIVKRGHRSTPPCCSPRTMTTVYLLIPRLILTFRRSWTFSVGSNIQPASDNADTTRPHQHGSLWGPDEVCQQHPGELDKRFEFVGEL